MILAAILFASATQIRFMPLTEGTTWTYEGSVEWTAGPNRTSSSRVRWETTIVRLFRGASREVAVVRGFPGDLAWYQPDQKPTYCVIEQTTSGLFLSRSESDEAAVVRLAEAIVSGKESLEQDDQIVEYPPIDGKCLGENPERRDRKYCRDLYRVSKTVWGVTERTNPDDETFEFTVGVGITKYSYHHHGTVANAEVRLVKRSTK